MDVAYLGEEIICLYTWLDECIKDCGLTVKQKEVLELYMSGMDEYEIAEELGRDRYTISGIINSICKKIVEQNYEAWKHEFVLWSQVKVDTDYKQCSKCKKWLPATKDFFSPDNYQGGFMRYCKKCENSRKKPCK